MATTVDEPPRTAIAATFSIPFSRNLSRDGEAERPLPKFAESCETPIALYRAMVLTRLFDEKAIALQRTGRLGTYASSLGQEAVAADIPGEQVDGNDLIAVRDAADRAIARARQGEGSSPIEAVTYRLSDHTTADDARRYRREAEVSAHWKDEPIARMRTHLVARGAWGREVEMELLTTHPHEAIVRTAQANHCDLIVMASHGRSGALAVLLGSETQKVLAHTKLPVLVSR